MCKNRILLSLLCARSTRRRCNEGESSQVHNLFDFASIFEGLKATIESYSTILQCYFLTGKHVEAKMDILKSQKVFLTAFVRLRPNVKIYTFCQGELLDEANKLL